MRASPVIIVSPGTDAGPGFAAGPEGIEEDALVFEAAPQPPDKDVAHPTAASVHGDADAGIPQRRGEGEAGEPAPLDALLRVKLLSGYC